MRKNLRFAASTSAHVVAYTAVEQGGCNRALIRGEIEDLVLRVEEVRLPQVNLEVVQGQYSSH